MTFLNQHNIALCLDKHKIQTRPNAGQGLWLMFLLPLALIVSTATHPLVSTPTYKLSSIFSLGLIFSSLVFLNDSSQNKRLRCLQIWLLVACCIVAVLFQICLHRGILFSFWSALLSTILYYKVYLLVLEKLPKCFTLGEAAVCSQSYILLLYFTIVNVFNTITRTPSNVMQISTLIIQIGLIGLSIGIILSHQFSLKSPFKFSLLAVFVVGITVILPLQILSKTNILLWILKLLYEDLQRNKVVLYWVLSIIIAVLVVHRQIKRAKKASSVVRKVFHFLIVAVYIPGLLYNCSLLYLASGVLLGIFFALEVLRVFNIPPFAETLQNVIVIFTDEKDSGLVAFTPIYLLAGCSLPLWIHPAPCDVTDSAIFSLLPLLSGVLTVGVGDTAASIVGSKFGSHHWKGTKKTIEGTVASIISQLLVVYLFIYLDFVKLHTIKEYVKVSSSIIITSIIEAKTDQVDNLVLPFIMYIILII